MDRFWFLSTQSYNHAGAQPVERRVGIARGTGTTFGHGRKAQEGVPGAVAARHPPVLSQPDIQVLGR